MSRITVIGLGAYMNQLSREAETALFAAECLFLQTDRCPAAQALAKAGRSFETFDALYDAAADFDALAESMAATLVAAAQKGDVVFAALGRASGLPALGAIARHAAENGVEMTLLPGLGYADAAYAKLAGQNGFAQSPQVRFANDIGSYDTDRPLAIEELDDRLIAGDTKLALLDHYPDEYEIVIACAGDDGYQHRTIPLCTLDQLADADYAHTTCALLPALPFDRKTRFSEADLQAIVRRLRAPGGCPWDREQTHKSIRADLLEEAYEVAEAIDQADDDMLLEELGDLMMQVYFHAVMAQERGAFNSHDIATGICEKLIYRHPHVFSTVRVENTAQVLDNWDALKRTEKHQSRFTDTLMAVPKPLPALTRAAKLQKKAAKAGFDWPDAQGALDKCEEERREFLAECISGDRDALAEEMGDWLFALVNAARLSGLDPELCLMAANEKFLARFAKMETLANNEGLSLDDCDLETLDAYWECAKSQTSNE